jgi:hypothetical protein
MAKTKYDKYFLEGPPEWASIGHAGPCVAYADDRLVKGCFYYTVAMIYETPPAEGTTKGEEKWGDISHGPHEHPNAEVIMHIGTNPDDPYDLGAEIELCMGPEMEKHLITKSSIVYIPPHFIHSPWTIKRVNRPFIMVVLDQGALHSEKSHPELIPNIESLKMAIIDEEPGGKKVTRRQKNIIVKDQKR